MRSRTVTIERKLQYNILLHCKEIIAHVVLDKFVFRDSTYFIVLSGGVEERSKMNVVQRNLASRQEQEITSQRGLFLVR